MTQSPSPPGESEDLRTRIAGLEAMLCDAQAEIGELKAALRPFAEAARKVMPVARERGYVWVSLGPAPIDIATIARAAELVPPENT